MFKRKGSKHPFFATHKSSKSLTSPPTPKPGRTLVLSSKSSTMDFKESCEKSLPTIDQHHPLSLELFSQPEPLFDDCYLQPQFFDNPLPLPNASEHNIWTSSPPRASSLKWSMDIEPRVESSDEEDDILDSYCDAPLEDSYLATQVTIIYAGKAKMIDIFPQKDTFKQPTLQPRLNMSRRSSASTRDYSASSYRYSDSDGRSSPASSISEYSHLVNETIPEEKPVEYEGSNLHSEVNDRPFKRGFHLRSASCASRSSIEIPQKPNISFLELSSTSSSNNSSVVKLHDIVTGPTVPTRLSSFSSDRSSITTDDRSDSLKSPWGVYLPEPTCS